MGCHTLFKRPITSKEFIKMKENAPKEIYELTGDSKENIESGMYDKSLYELLMKSYNENIPCVYGFYWWQLGYGSCELSYREIYNGSGLYVEVGEYLDLFRVYHYPRKIIKNRRELRKFLRKQYFQLSNKQLEQISEFFKENDGGVIMFG